LIWLVFVIWLVTLAETSAEKLPLFYVTLSDNNGLSNTRPGTIPGPVFGTLEQNFRELQVFLNDVNDADQLKGAETICTGVTAAYNYSCIPLLPFSPVSDNQAVQKVSEDLIAAFLIISVVRVSEKSGKFGFRDLKIRQVQDLYYVIVF
jgi:hypothetical protein